MDPCSKGIHRSFLTAATIAGISLLAVGMASLQLPPSGFQLTRAEALRSRRKVVAMQQSGAAIRR